MKVNKLIFVSLLLLTIFTLSAVSATDNVTVETLTVDDDADLIQESAIQENEINTVEQKEIIEISSDNNILSEKEDPQMNISFVSQDENNVIYPISAHEDIIVDNYKQDYFKVYFSKKVSGNVSLFIDNNFIINKTYNSVKNHYLYVNLKEYKLTEGIHNWEIKYSGDETYKPISQSGTFTLNPTNHIPNKNDSGMNISFVSQDENNVIYPISAYEDIIVDNYENDYFRIHFENNVSGKLSLFIDGKFREEKRIFNQNHYMFVNVKDYNLIEGNHTWEIKYSGDEIYNSISENGTFKLNPQNYTPSKKDSKMNVYVVTKDGDKIYSIDEEEDILENNKNNDYFKITFPTKVKGKLSLYIDGKLVAKKTITKKTHYLYVNSEKYSLSKGKHSWEIKYSGDSEYDSKSLKGTFNIKIIKGKSGLILSGPKKIFKTNLKTKKYTVTLKSNSKKPIKKVNVQMTIKGKNYKKVFKAKTNAKGQATFKITKLTKKGTYTVTITFKGTPNYKAISAKTKIKVTAKKCTINKVYKKVADDKIPTPESIQGYVDPAEAYKHLNEFRLEKGVWIWEKGNVNKKEFNTDEDNALKPLKIDEKLQETAKIRAEEISRSFSHTRPDGTICFTAFPSCMNYGENIAYGVSTGKAVTELWKETNDLYDGQGHRRNMLDMDFDSVGIAGFQKDGIIYWVQCFGMRSLI